MIKDGVCNYFILFHKKHDIFLTIFPIKALKRKMVFVPDQWNVKNMCLFFVDLNVVPIGSLASSPRNSQNILSFFDFMPPPSNSEILDFLNPSHKGINMKLSKIGTKPGSALQFNLFKSTNFPSFENHFIMFQIPKTDIYSKFIWLARPMKV